MSDEITKVCERAGGWFAPQVPGTTGASGPWRTREAAEAASRGMFFEAWDLDREASRVGGSGRTAGERT